MNTGILQIEISNFRLFSNIKIDFHENMTVLIADNGMGKSTLMQALAIVWAPLIMELSQSRFRGIEEHDVRRIRDSEGAMIPLLPVNIQASALINQQPRSWKIIRDSLKPRAKGYHAEELTDILSCAKTYYDATVSYAKKERETPPVLPIILRYGTDRIWSNDNRKLYNKTKREDSSRFRGYADALSTSASFAFFQQWFEEFSREAQQEQTTETKSPHNPVDRLKAVQVAIEHMMAPTGWSKLSWGFVEKTVMVEHAEHGRLPVAWLSDGTKSILAMVADIAHRCVRLNPQFGAEAPQKTPGIVLIDEVDMHLHPSWQQTVLGSLRRAFPSIQFIVTTHSPQVLSTVNRENIRTIRPATNGQFIATPPLARTYGEPSGDVMQSVMMVDPQPPVSEKADLQRLTEWVDQGNYQTSEAKQLMQDLETALGTEHPQLQRLKRSIRRQESLKQ